MGFTEGADLRVSTCFLLQDHAPNFEVADLGDHGALHNGTTLVVLDIAHPLRLLERDLLCKALLFEVPDGVVVSVS